MVWEKDAVSAVEQLLQLPGLRKFSANLKNPQEQEQFKRHLKRYVHIYMPDCPFEVTTTNRYTITDHEASITARRDINPREEIKYLTGVQVAMTEEQEKTLELARKDFSLVISSRKKTRSLFLGPARFANHDCDANAKLSTKGYDGMQIVAVKPIIQGEEVTVSYGDDYFGENNEECLCHTCERRQQNGWAPLKRVEESDEEGEEDEKNGKQTSGTKEEDVPTITEVSKKRLRDDCMEGDVSIDSTHESKRTRIEKEQPSSLLREIAMRKAHSASSLRQEIPISSIEDSMANLSSPSQLSQEVQNQQHGGLATMSLDETSSSRETTPRSSSTDASANSSHSTDATSADEEHPITSDVTKIEVNAETLHNENPALGVATVKEETTTTVVKAPWPSPPAEVDNMSDLSELSSNFEFDSENEQIVKRKPRPTLRNTRSRSAFFESFNSIGTPVSTDLEDDAAYVENNRKPGDYMTSNSLLSAKYSKWVECQTCEVSFVQQDGYLTRKECPRCERHSKLYGFAWPKTEREGKHDREQRIQDHRTVHRFVDPDEERQLKKEKTKKVMKEVIRERFSTPRSGRDSASAEVDSGRLRRRVRKTM